MILKNGGSISTTVLLAALMNMLGGGKVVIDHYDWIQALKTASQTNLIIHTQSDPFRVVLEVREDE